ncbi:MAG: CYTH domain-containing protein [Thermomicrobiales bacterium]
MPESQELEGKFACREEDLNQLLALTRIGEFRLVQRDERTQTDTYFDTASLDLRSQSCSLRKRSIGDEVKATFKGPRQSVDNAEDASHLVKRLEIEVSVVPPPADEKSFLDRTDLEPVSRAQEMLESTGQLDPIARIVTHRRMLNYARSESESVELSLDNVQALDLRTNRRTHIIEVELELIDGTDETLVSAATSLRQAIPSLRPTSESKLARTLGEHPESKTSSRKITTAR